MWEAIYMLKQLTVYESFQFVEIHYHADGIKFVRTDGQLHLPIMPMQRLQRTIIKPKLVRRREFAAAADLKRHIYHGIR